MEFKRILKRLRGDKFLSQVDLANKLNISRQLVTALENGKSAPSVATLVALADFFDVSVDFLVGRTERKQVSLPKEFTDEDCDLVRDFARLIHERKNRK
ncbi:MAG: helix-turn-helix domain-containing protein [Oscillospiraceae bacterium]|jgi:transcriptional regulator with XRE-family HTH domain|nr:helix-turn-helix domain-containing protein [Oscillospiraceae bacterium]